MVESQANDSSWGEDRVPPDGNLGMPFAAQEVIEDRTGEHDDAKNELAKSLVSVSLQDEARSISIKPRAYQLEMKEESLRKNVIVAVSFPHSHPPDLLIWTLRVAGDHAWLIALCPSQMDTGSGKTHVAVLRVLAELDRIASHELIWFLAPTVALCSQQYDYFKSHISTVQIKFLSGNDGVDRWTQKSHWDSVLKNVKLVISTYQILLDALSHGFVHMESLALIVFDEGAKSPSPTAHNCVGKHPGSQIMHKFYHPDKAQGCPVPHILGLTASPAMRSDAQSVIKIEETLDAICRTPSKHRAELRDRVKLPVLCQVYFEALPSESALTGHTHVIQSLAQVYSSLRISEDPYVLGLIEEGTDRSLRKLEKVLKNHKTWCQMQIKSFYGLSLKICRELGAWAANFYISEVITRFLQGHRSDVDGFSGLWDISNAEKNYLADVLRHVKIIDPTSQIPDDYSMVSDKFSKLVDVILSESEDVSGIVFVQERAMVSVLAHILSVLPATRKRFKVGTMVGTSQHSLRSKDIGELIDADAQQTTLPLFKSKVLNLVIATSVLEEGIDVPACNIVICFQKPANLKSFVQRRGRARQKDSKLVLLLDNLTDRANDWEDLELTMKRMYEDEMRTLQEVLTIEENEEHDGRQFKIERTGALIDLDNSLAHLHHFCAALPRKQYVDLRPDFICTPTGGSLVVATVILPLSVDEAVRVAHSRTAWLSEKNAIKDAAFEAYIALYRAGLVNENLLPLLRHDPLIDELESTMVETRPSIVRVREQINPWTHVSEAWKYLEGQRDRSENTNLKIQQAAITLGNLNMRIYLPVAIPQVAPFRLYWDEDTELQVTTTTLGYEPVDISEYPNALTETWSMLSAAFGARFPISWKPFAALFTAEGPELLQNQMGCQSISDFVYAAQLGKRPPYFGLVKDKLQNNLPYIYRSWLANKPPIESVQHPYQDYAEAPEDLPHLHLARLTKRSDFLHKPIATGLKSEKPLAYVLPTSRCSIDYLPFRYVQFAMVMPCILHKFGTYLLADKLSNGLLKEVGITDLGLIITAISASSAASDTNYQRLEFLGDSVLKLCTSVQLVAEYPLWHEGYLSARKDRLVANSRLSRAAITAGLDAFIMTKQFSGHRWRPLYVDEILQMMPAPNREMSSKVLADVVEALVGAAMVNGGISKALKCLQIFLPEIKWQPLEQRQMFLYERAPDLPLPNFLEPLETMLGYSFKKKALLIEAMTHASCNSGTQSLERLEFLGDSLLDTVVVEAVFGHNVELSHVQMHLLRTALVNADFLAFACMEWTIEQESRHINEIKSNSGSEVVLQESTSTVQFPLWKFMRHMSPMLAMEQAATSARHSQLRDSINKALNTGSTYPWHLLAKLQAPKFFSDLVESLLGALWIDSGSFEVCRAVIERLGILPYLARVLRDGVHVLHPKEELGMLADTERVRYELEARTHDLGGAASPEYLCRVSVGFREVVLVGDGVSKEEVMVKAAEAAVRILKREKENGGGLQVQDDDDNDDDDAMDL
ncbi:dicer-like protein 2 [Phlyctema vagabunda]|uniref:Dicer-like protein 2 n=1 Tax=Phlyctema vagabunda TaxID=108571 RepID=A0ABR4PGG8_9HELO